MGRHLFVTDWNMPEFEIEAARLQEHGWTVDLPELQRPTPPREEFERELIARLDACQQVDAVLFQLAPVAGDFIRQLPATCRILQRVGIGLDNVDHAAAAERNIPVRNTPGYCIDEVASHAMAMILSLHRQLRATHATIDAGNWPDRSPKPIEPLATQTLGIVGLGRIGGRVANLMQPMVKQVLFTDPNVGPTPPFERVEFVDLLAASDIVSLHCPLDKSTRDLIDDQALSRVRPDAILVNTARGALINANALIARLDSVGMGGVGLDVFEPEVLAADSTLRNRDNVMLTSHTAWYSEASSPRSRNMALDSIFSMFSER